MNREIFVLACQLAAKTDYMIDIGGGEPTLHPLFWDFIGIALRYEGSRVAATATNGKRKADALALARISKRRVLCVDLSLDPYHEPIDSEVIAAFEKASGVQWTDYDYRGIRDITHGGVMGPAPFGRAESWANIKDIRCPSNDLFIAPDGTIYACGCRKVTYGTIYKPELPDPIPDQWCPDKLGEHPAWWI